MAAAKQKLKKGDVVRLKSGGPLMTVASDAGEFSTVACIWFKGSTRQSGNFSPEILLLEPDGEK